MLFTTLTTQKSGFLKFRLSISFQIINPTLLIHFLMSSLTLVIVLVLTKEVLNGQFSIFYCSGGGS